MDEDEEIYIHRPCKKCGCEVRENTQTGTVSHVSIHDHSNEYYDTKYCYACGCTCAE